MSAATDPDASLNRTPLYELHVSLGAKMVPFAGYEMPVQYPLGILKEHLHTREKAGLFDVSHMGQAFLIGPDHDDHGRRAGSADPRRHRSISSRASSATAQLLNDEGGIIDDLMVTRSHSADDDGSLMLVVNASRKEVDYAHIAARLPD